jgi:hypothetical protein
VYTRNRSGGIVRTQTTLPWTPTDLRGLAVDNLNTALALWSLTLTQAQRDAWNAFATVQSRAHTAIAQTQLSGQAWFLKLSVPLIWVGEEAHHDPPANLSVTQLTTFSIDRINLTPGEFVVNWQPGLPADHVIRFFATDSISLGISAWLHQLGWAGDWFDTHDTTCDILEPYEGYHPAPVPNLKIGATARFLNLANGVYSRPLQATAIVEA